MLVAMPLSPGLLFYFCDDVLPYNYIKLGVRAHQQPASDESMNEVKCGKRSVITNHGGPQCVEQAILGATSKVVRRPE